MKWVWFLFVLAVTLFAASNTDLYNTHIKEAQVYKKNKQYTESAQELLKAEKLRPEESFPYCELSVLYHYFLRKPDLALENVQQCINRTKGSTLFYYEILEKTLRKQNQSPETFSFIQQTCHETHSPHACALMEGRWNAYVEETKKQKKTYKEIVQKANLLQKEKMYSKAFEQYQKAANLNIEGEYVAHLNAALTAFYKLKNYAVSIQYAKEAMLRGAKNYDLDMLIAQAQEKLHETQTQKTPENKTAQPKPQSASVALHPTTDSLKSSQHTKTVDKKKLYYTQLKQAREAKDNQEYANAIAYYNKARTYKEWEAAYSEAAPILYWHLADSSRALNDIKHAIEIFPKRISNHLKYRHYLSQNRLDNYGKEQRFQQSICQKTQSPVMCSLAEGKWLYRTYMENAKAYEREASYQKALKAYQQAIAVRGDGYYAYLRLARLLAYKLSAYDKAKHYLIKALELAPKDQEALKLQSFLQTN